MINFKSNLSTILLVLVLLSSGSANAQLSCFDSKDEQNIANCTTLADSGDAKAQNTLGQIYYQDALVHKGYHTKARILFEKAANQGLAKAQYNLGAMYRDEFNNFPVALSWFEKAAAQGDLDAQNSMGYIYENGSGGPEPRLYIFDENGKNVDPNLPDIEARFAPYMSETSIDVFPFSIYPTNEFGQGIEPDLTKALYWYQQAAEQGHALAQTNLAYFYLMGVGVDKDDKKAFALYQQAAAQNFVPALKSLAFMYVQGLGTDENIPKAFKLLEQAYVLQPDNALWNIISVKMDRRYSLKTSLKEKNTVYRKQFEYNDSSDEDYIHERLKFLNAFYQLNMVDGDSIANLYVWGRKTAQSILGNTLGENSVLIERYYLKKSIQGYYSTMRMLSYYYKGEEQDIAKAQLWRKYAIKMGEFDLPNYWPDYDKPSTTNNP